MTVYYTQKNSKAFGHSYKLQPSLNRVINKKKIPNKLAKAIAKAGSPLIPVKDNEGGLPDTGGKPHLDKEKVLLQVELLMLKGVTTTHSIATMLGLNYGTVKRYKDKVEYRWSAKGRHANISLIRGKARQRLETITNELWVAITNTDSATLKFQGLQALLATHDRQMILDGLTPKIIESLKDELMGALSGGKDPQKLIEDHQSMLELGSALAGYLAKEDTNEKSKVIDVPPK